MFAVCVTFHIKDGHTDRFLPLMQRQAQNSLSLETDCVHFDVCLSDDKRTVFLYELYTNAAAFDAHLASEHFKTFDAATRDMIAHKDVATFKKLSP